MTPEEEAELQSLRNQFAPDQQAGFFSRLGQNLANTPGYVKAGLQNMVAGGLNLLPGVDLPKADSNDDAFYPLPPASGPWQTAADVLGKLPSEFIQYAMPAGGLERAGALMGLGRAAAPVANVGAGALLGLRDNHPVSTAAEFGAMSGVNALADLAPGGAGVKMLLRGAGNAAIPSASAALQGQDPFSQQVMTQGAMQGLLGSGAAEAVAKRLFRPRAVAPAAEAPHPSAPTAPDSGVPQLEWPYGDLRSVSTSGDPIINDPTLGQQGQLALPGPVTSPDARPWQMIQWPYGGGQGIPLPEPPGVRPRMAARQILARQSPPTIDVSADVQPISPSGETAATQASPVVTPETAPSVPESAGTSNVTAGIEKNVNDFLMMNGGDHAKAADMAQGYGLADVADELRRRAPVVEPLLKKNTEVAPDLSAPTDAPEVQSTIGPEVAPASGEPSAGRIGQALLRWKNTTDPVEKQRLWKQMQDLDAANPPGMKLGEDNESGAVNTPFLVRAGGAVAGGIAGYTEGDTQEDRMRNAAIGAGMGLLGGHLALAAAGNGKSLLKLASSQGRNELARQAVQPEAGVPTTMLNKAARWMEANHPSLSPETFRALEKAKGKESLVRGMVDDASSDFLNIASTLTPADKAVGDRFLGTAAKPADVAALDASTVPQPYKDFLKATQAAKIESQKTILRGENDPRKRMTIAASIGTWATRQYRAIVDPGTWVNDPVKEAKVVDQWLQSPEFKGMDASTMQAILRQHAAELGAGGFQNLKPSDPRISSTLYKNRRDFSPGDWQFIDNFANEPHLNPAASKFLKDMVASKTVDAGDQAVIRAMAGLKGTYHSDAARLREIADKEVLTPEYRDWLGEITDPVTRQILSVNKLANSVRGAEAFNQLSSTTFSDGRKMSYTPREFDTAKATATPAQLEAMKDYALLPNNPSLGKMAGQMVPREAADSINAMFDPKMRNVGAKWWAVANSWMKEMLTVANPSTQIRQFAQIPFFAATARVYPHELPGLIADYARVMRDPKSALRREITENHVTNANFAENDLVSLEKAFEGQGPNMLTQARNAMRKLYRIPDDLVRGVTFLKHKDAFLEEAAAKGMSGDQANTYALNKTLDHLRDYTMNYSTLPQTVNIAKHLPGISPFVSYSYEMARITKNLLRDVATGDARSKVHAAAALATLYALPAGLSIAAKNILLSGKDREDWEKIQNLMPTYQRFQFMAPINREKDGTFRTIGINSWMPAADLGSIMAAAGRGDWESMLSENPVFGLEKHPLVSAAIDASRGENYFTHEPLDTPVKKAARVAEALVPSYTPGVGYLGKKLLRSFTPNADGGLGITDLRSGRQDTPTTGLLATVGATTQFVQPRSLLMRAKSDMLEKLDTAKSDARRRLLTNRTDADKERTMQLLQKKAADIAQDYRQKVEAANK